MKRTALIFAVAGALGLSALVLWLVPVTGSSRVDPPVPPPLSQPVPTPLPMPTPAADTGGPLTMTAALSDPYLHAGGMREVFLKVELEAVRIGESQRAAVNLALVLDRSGSMAGEKIAHARRAARHLVDQLDERDRLTLITFGSEVNTLVESVQATPAAKQRLHQAIDGISELGGTNISGGLEAALAELVSHKSAYSVSRVVLLSDGQANMGIVSPEGLSALARNIASHGIGLSTIGVGLDFNELVMEALADYGGGAYHFLSDSEQLTSIFARELQQATATVASGVQLTIRPSNGAAPQEAYGYLAESDGDALRVRLPDFASGERRKVMIRLLVPANQIGALHVADLRLDYADVTRDRAPATATVAVSATVTSDYGLAMQKRNHEVGAAAAHAEAVKSMREAGQRYASGQRAEAEVAIRKARKKLEAARSVYGASEALNQAESEVRAFEDAVQSYAAPSAAAKRIHSFSNSVR